MAIQVGDKTELWNRWVALWNGNLAIADEIISPNIALHFSGIGVNPADIHGPEGMKQWIGGSRSVFSDASFTVSVGPIIDGKMIAGRWIFRGTYKGGIPGASSNAEGKQIEYAGMDMLRIENNLIVEYWLCADIVSMFQQLGVMPS